ncbi:MAG: hypothetical protein WEB53_05635 [Akkermansiaceae bacterium]
MKRDPEDPRPTSYLLGELEADEATAFELNAATDPELQTTLREMPALHEKLTKALIVPPEQLTPAQHATILRAARKIDRSAKVLTINVQRRRRKPWAVFLAAAAAITLAFLIVSGIQKIAPADVAEQQPTTDPPASEPQENPNLPAPGPVTTEALAANDAASPAPPAITPPAITPPAITPPLIIDESGIPALRSRESVTVAEFPTLSLPIHSGKSSLGWITQSIREERRLPSRDAVRLEEVLNSFPIRLNGVTAVARAAKTVWHPDSREAGTSIHTATLTSEMLSCPWKPSAKLLLISIRGNASNDCEANVIFRPSATHVFRYRLLGFAPVDGKPSEKMPTRLAAGSAHTLVIEIEPSTPTGELGAIEWTVNGEPAAGISVNRIGDIEPSDDARFAALVCTYAQWLAGEQAGIIDADLLAALAREIASETLPVERTQFLHLIDLSLRL